MHFVLDAKPLRLFLAAALWLGPSLAYAADGDLPPQPGEDVEADLPVKPPAPSPPARVDWEIAGIADYASAPIRGGTNPFGFGFGGRFGLSVSKVYVGLSVVDYLGGTDVTLSDQALLFGGELGYGIVLHQFATGVTLTLRPMVGVGNAAISHTDPSLVQTTKPDVVTTASGRTVSTGGSTTDTTTIDNVYLRPSVTLLLAGGWHFVAIEGSATFLPGISYAGADPSTWISYGAQVQLGVRF